MKNLLLIISIAIVGLAMISATTVSNEISSVPQEGTSEYTVPGDIQVILDKSCYMCHNSESKSTKGKMKLDFDKLSDMKTSKLVGKMVKIKKTVVNEKMPKKSFIEKYPDKALTDDEKTRLIEWADGIANAHGGE